MSLLEDLAAGRLRPGVHRCSTTHDVEQVRAVADGAGWHVARLDGSIDSTEELHRTLARELRFPAYYGRNLDALRDCLRDVSPSTLLVWDEWWTLAAAHPRQFGVVVDLLGEAVTVLLRGDDVGRDLGPGAVVSWID